MDKQELRQALDRVFEIGSKYSRSFSMWNWLGLSGFADEQLEMLNRVWLRFEGGGTFEEWLQRYHADMYRQYSAQLTEVWDALKTHTNVADAPSITGLKNAQRQLDS